MRPTRQHDIQFHKPTKTFFERNLQKPDIRELRRPFNPKIAPSEFVPRAEPKVATGTMDLTLPCMLNLFGVIYSGSGNSHTRNFTTHKLQNLGFPGLMLF